MCTHVHVHARVDWVPNSSNQERNGEKWENQVHNQTESGPGGLHGPTVPNRYLGQLGASSASDSRLVPERKGREERRCQGMKAHRTVAIGTGFPAEHWREAVLLPFLRLPGAEATCHHIFSNSAEECLRKVKDKSLEVCMFESHLTRQLCGARGNTPAAAPESCSHFACLVVQALGEV